MDKVFITGGSSGIGAGLAKAFHARGAKVIIGGRDKAALEQVASGFAGMESIVVDVSDPTSVEQCAQKLAALHPDLNTVINNAGLQRLVDFSGDNLPTSQQIDLEIDTNLKGVMYVTSAFLPLLRRQPTARLIQVSSGLGFVPLVRAPIYSATKAAIHAFSVALRQQLQSSHVRVIELIPPIVETNLHREQAHKPPRAMSLDDFITQAMQGLEKGRDEVPVGLAKVLRIGARLAPGRFLKIVNKARGEETKTY